MDDIVVFETLRTYPLNNIFAQEEHLDRLFRSAEILELDLAPLRAQFPATPLRDVLKTSLQKAVSDAQSKNDLRIKISLSEKNFWIEIQDLVPAPEDWYEKGIEIIDAEFERPFAEAKYANSFYAYFAKRQSESVFETIFFNQNRQLREGNISNVFAVFGNVLVTPDKNILKGVTRSRVLKIAQEQGLDIQLREIAWEELLKADEIFLTNTSKEVLPVRKWGSWTRDQFPVAQQLRKAFCLNRDS